MTMLARVAGFAAALMLLAAPRLEAQSSAMRVTIASGPRAGSYELVRSRPGRWQDREEGRQKDPEAPGGVTVRSSHRCCQSERADRRFLPPGVE